MIQLANFFLKKDRIPKNCFIKSKSSLRCPRRNPPSALAQNLLVIPGDLVTLGTKADLLNMPKPHWICSSSATSTRYTLPSSLLQFFSRSSLVTEHWHDDLMEDTSLLGLLSWPQSQGPPYMVASPEQICPTLCLSVSPCLSLTHTGLAEMPSSLS